MKYRFCFSLIVGASIVLALVSNSHAFNSQALDGSISFSRINAESSAEEYGLWVVYSTTSGWRMKSHIEAFPVEMASDGSFSIPEIKFGMKGYKRFYPAMPMSGIISAMRDRHVPEPRRLRIVLVSKNGLRLENEQITKSMFYVKRYDFDFLSPLKVYGWADFQLEECEEVDAPCGIEDVESALASLQAHELDIDLGPSDDRVQRLFTALEPRMPSVSVSFEGKISDVYLINWSAENPFFVISGSDDDVFRFWGRASFRVGRDKVQYLEPKPTYLTEYKEVLYSESSPNQSLQYHKVHEDAFEWTLEFEREVERAQLDDSVFVQLSTSYGFDGVDVRN